MLFSRCLRIGTCQLNSPRFTQCGRFQADPAKRAGPVIGQQDGCRLFQIEFAATPLEQAAAFFGNGFDHRHRIQTFGRKTIARCEQRRVMFEQEAGEEGRA